MTPSSFLGAGAVAVLVVTLPLGGRLFAGAVVLTGLAALIELAAAMARGGLRPVVPAAAVGGVGVAVLQLFGADAGWEQVPGALAAAVLVGFLIALLSPRSTGITAALGATVLVGLLVAMGTIGLLELRQLPEGFRWSAAAVALVVIPAITAVVARRFSDDALLLGARIVAAGAVGGILATALNPPFSIVTAAVTTVLGGVAAAGGRLLLPALSGGAADAGPGPADCIGDEALLAGVLLAAGAVFLLTTVLLT